MIINMVGGGGGFSASNAILGITAYAGSTVSISNGTVTKIVTPDKSHVLSDNTDYAIYYFGIPSGMFSSSVPWNIISTYQTEETTATVIIDTNAFYDVVLTYIVPYDYQQVTYLQSDGNQYIDTLINTDNIGKLQMQFMTFNGGTTGGQRYIFGGTTSLSSTSDTLQGFGLSSQRAGAGLPFRYVVTGGETSAVYFPLGYEQLGDLELILIGDNKSCTINNTSRALSNIRTITFNGSLYIFTMNFNNSTNLNSNNPNRIYSCDIFNYDNEKIASLIPCYRKSDNVAGMYDNVNKRFLINQGTGTFVVGSDVTE